MTYLRAPTRKASLVKRTGILLLLCAATFAAWTTTTTQAQDSTPAGPKLETTLQKGSYGAGYQLAKFFGELDLDLLRQGFEDAMAGKKPAIDERELQAAQQELRQTHANKAAAEASKKNEAEGAAFLEANKAKEGVMVTASGLQYKVLTPTDGAKPGKTDKVTVNYHGTLIDGTVFDSSIKPTNPQRPAKPITFALDRVIPGWTEGVQLMTVGSKYRFFIPSKLAYGQRQAGPLIGPGSTLIFDVELIAIEAAPAPAKPETPKK